MFTFKTQRNNFFFQITVLSCAFSILCLANLFNLDYDRKTFAQNDTIDKFPSSVKIKGLYINVTLAKTPDEQAKGLSIKNSLKENEGMLFIQDAPVKSYFNMKDMKFPIDIIWIHPNNTIAHIEKNLQPCISFLLCASYSPNVPAQHVLEVNAHYTTKNNITVGDEVEFNIVDSSGG
ncbi:MAG TPA: DUF192 domain-containing protein [Bacillales bacterium]|nr:DUF192 domain-containing protein [Bacillales bacterium]